MDLSTSHLLQKKNNLILSLRIHVSRFFKTTISVGKKKKKEKQRQNYLPFPTPTPTTRL
jgi:hypothetical protein